MQLSKRIFRKIKSLFSSNKQDILVLNYLGYKLFYSKGTSIVGRITKDQPIYEPDTSEFLVSALKGLDSPCFLDIGANIGFLSLYVQKFVPNVKIFAFEPGPHQNKLFEKTIRSNSLSKSVILSNYALSDKAGKSTFCVHSSDHVSGDGFYDTGRAGNYKEITVSTIKLDEWWVNLGEPKIDLIKIDTEGAELFILRGAKIMFEACSPVVYFEMCSLNYSVYNYDHFDILELLHSYNYLVFSSEETLITHDNVEETLHKYSNYIAKKNIE
jgi:FkbM family methyltransferase